LYRSGSTTFIDTNTMKENDNSLSRRGFLASAGLITGSLFLAPDLVFAKRQESPVNMIIDEASKSPVTVQKLKGKLTLIKGSGGNIVVMAGNKAKLMVDAGINVSESKMKAALATLNNAPLQTLINTHWHFDHASGNEWIHNAGAEIVAHENTKKRLMQKVTVEDWNYTFPPSPAGAIPAITFSKEHRIIFEGETIHLKHYGPAHTDGDISVFFPDVDVLHVADTWWNGYYPFIDYNTGGNIMGMIRAAKENVERTSDKTLIVSGHGPLGNRSQLIAYRDMLVDTESKIRSMKNQGMGLQEIIAARPTKAYDEKWGKFVIGPDFYTRLVYKGIV
jgi:glyoxylase-like metal-dependent hydrolase (beta-lactamase superfamily II)